MGLASEFHHVLKVACLSFFLYFFTVFLIDVSQYMGFFFLQNLVQFKSSTVGTHGRSLT